MIKIQCCNAEPSQKITQCFPGESQAIILLKLNYFLCLKAHKHTPFETHLSYTESPRQTKHNGEKLFQIGPKIR